MDNLEDIVRNLKEISTELEMIRDDLELILIEDKKQALKSLNSAISYIDNDVIPWLKD